MRYLFLLIFVMTLLSSKFANSKQITIITQDSISRNSVVFYINQPVGFINKVRIKAGYKSEKNSTYLLSLTNFNSGFDLLFSKRKYTGLQFCFEYQHAINKGKQSELFVYGKTGIGNYNFEEESGIIFSFSDQVSGSYYVFGGGIGDEMFLNKSKTVFIQSNLGFKICHIYKLSKEKPESTFKSVISPGSVIDVNINFGFRF